MAREKQMEGFANSHVELNNIIFEAQLKYYKCLINYPKLKKIKN